MLVHLDVGEWLKRQNTAVPKMLVNLAHNMQRLSCWTGSLQQVWFCNTHSSVCHERQDTHQDIE